MGLHWLVTPTTWRAVGRGLLAGAGLLLALVVGVGALLGAASLSDVHAHFLGLGLAAFALVAAASIALVTRGLTAPRGLRWRIALAGTASAVGLGAAFAVLVPLNDPSMPAAAVPGQRFWDLPTGSRIAYVKIPAVGTARPTPIIVVHGGPGMPQMAVDAPFFGQLARDGYDV